MSLTVSANTFLLYSMDGVAVVTNSIFFVIKAVINEIKLKRGLNMNSINVFLKIKVVNGRPSELKEVGTAVLPDEWLKH